MTPSPSRTGGRPAHLGAPGGLTHLLQGVLRVSLRDKKVLHGSTGDRRALRSLAPKAVDAHVGHSWVADSPAAQETALQRSGELASAPVLHYMGTDIYLQGCSTAPQKISPIKEEISGQTGPRCCDDGIRGQGPHKAIHHGQHLPPHGHNPTRQRRPTGVKEGLHMIRNTGINTSCNLQH